MTSSAVADKANHKASESNAPSLPAGLSEISQWTASVVLFKKEALMNVYCALALTTLIAFTPIVEAKQKRDVKATNLSKMLKPGKMDQRVDASHLSEVAGRLVGILNTLEQSSRSAGPPPKDLLKRAYAMRNDVDYKYAELARTAIYDAWREANSLGLFNSEGVFGRTISDGSDQGKEVVFQYIIPVQHVPTFSRSFCNVELTSPTKQRVTDDPSKFDTRTITYGKRLRSYATSKQTSTEQEAKRKADAAKRPKPLPRSKVLAPKYRIPDGPTYRFQRTKAEHEARWNELRKADPGSADRQPNISADIKRKSNPSRKSGGKYVQIVSFENRSSFPTEITFDFCFIGKTDNGPEYVSVMRKTNTVKILPSDRYESQESFTTGYASYRGYASVALFKGEIIATTASDARMNAYTKKGAMDALPRL